LGKAAATAQVAIGRIGRYEVRREIGRGPMGIVYEAQDPELGRAVAIKTAPFDLTKKDPHCLEDRFLAEARIVARLSHPSIVAIHDVGRDEDTGTLYMALELLEGPTLAEVTLKRAPIDWREALRITSRIAEALEHARRQGVMHCSVEPDHIVLLPSGQPKIMGLGFDVVHASMPEPDLVRSLGMIAWRLAADRPPFGAPIREIPAHVSNLLRRAIARDSAQRYPTVRTFVDDIQDVMAGRVPRSNPRSDGQATHPHGEPPTLAFEVEPVANDGKAAGGTLRAEVTVRSRPSTWGRAAVVLVGVLLATTVGDLSRRATSDASPSASSAVISPAAGFDPTAALPARLTLGLDHPFESGRLRVWVDDMLVLRRDLRGGVKRKLIGLKLRKGNVRESLELRPGRREVRVEVAWNGGARSESLAGSFRAGATRYLEIKVGRLRKNLTLGWR
jgi:hypothetical protein